MTITMMASAIIAGESGALDSFSAFGICHARLNRQDASPIGFAASEAPLRCVLQFMMAK
ncbi:MAG: hypothetical protein J0M28_09855 [Thauera sp.]|nr:hypothetical protein [Thauera sp.]